MFELAYFEIKTAYTIEKFIEQILENKLISQNNNFHKHVLYLILQAPLSLRVY